MPTSCQNVEQIYNKISYPGEAGLNRLLLGAIFQFVHYAKLNSNEKLNIDLEVIKLKLDAIISSGATSSVRNTINLDKHKYDFVITECINTINYACATKSVIKYTSTKWKKNSLTIDRQVFNLLWRELKVARDLKDKVFELSEILSSGFNKEHYNEKFKYYLWELISSYLIFLHIFRINKKCIAITLNPYHSMDLGMIMACKQINRKIWFLPHGLPQRSSYLHDFDYVTPLTISDNQWRNFNAKFIYLPWCESDGLIVGRYNTSPETKKYRILFFSQLSGAKLHQTKGLISCAIDTINQLILRSDIYSIKIRLRNRDEYDIYLNSIDCNKVTISYASEQNIHQDIENNDILMACSSTALLYGQVYNKSIIQITDDNIINTWPYQLTSAARTIHSDKNICHQLNIALMDIKANPFNTKLLFKNVVSDYSVLFGDKS